MKKERKVSKKAKTESRSDEDFDFASIISSKSKSSNNYFKSKEKEIYPDQTPIKKVKTNSANELDLVEDLCIEKQNKILSNIIQVDSQLIVEKGFNIQRFSRLLNETMDSLVKPMREHGQNTFDQLQVSLERLMNSNIQMIINVGQKHGKILDAILIFMKKFLMPSDFRYPFIEKYGKLIEALKLGIYSEVIEF